ncbi:hypothetical protein GGI07_003137 [Coemansia sp. Benny D115]|nr:hypothetical protein GGI07_003137 [Coemansia sp. Benny D115]
MSSATTVIYGPGRSVSVKTTPTTTLQAVISAACKVIPGTPNPDAYSLAYNNKIMDSSLTIRFANLPAGAKLTLTPRRQSKSSPAATQGRTADPPVKVALQIVGGGRLIDDYPASSTLWDILTQVEARSNGTLNLTTRCRTVSPSKAAGPQSPIARGLDYLGSMFGLPPSSGNNTGNNSDAEDGAKTPEGVKTPKLVYQQPVLAVLNNEISTLEDIQSTTLRSLGFTGGSVLIRLSFRDSDAPAPAEKLRAPAPMPVRVPADGATAAEPHVERRSEPMQSPSTSDLSRAAAAADEQAKPIASNNATQQRQQNSRHNGGTGPAEKPTPVSPSEAASPASDSGSESDAAVLAARQVRVFKKPLANSASLSSRFVLPASFYESGSDDLKLLVSVQRARQAESERGFKSRIKQEQEEQAKHEQLRDKYPKTSIRFRFPDLDQVQATFLSSEPVAEMFAFVQSIVADPKAVKTLVVQPPVQDLATMRATSLFNAKLTPAAVVHVRLQSADAVATASLLKPRVWSMAEALETGEALANGAGRDSRGSPAPAASSPEATSDINAPPPSSAKRPTTSLPQPKNATGTSDGPKMPKWFLAGQKRA